ncbi:hypothetical protein [Frigoribacterium sp. VKM Ac-2836]|uniref:hypothetical protein n=1 Tax=Frigoribacterium sp. VKM Ac-2836 TaxID=2739014 RepID=UPI0015673C8E|nr:hypothetical protein [Frigoribacterium sp. VKM Ac-2836]NRD25856.1 hypothetical protein [Frigoribacterium sp. VKM Ac-2836]
MGDAIEDLLDMFAARETGATVLPSEGVPEEVEAIIAETAAELQIEVVVARTAEIVHLAWRPVKA